MLCAFGHGPPSSPNMHLAPNGAWRGEIPGGAVEGQALLLQLCLLAGPRPARTYGLTLELSLSQGLSDLLLQSGRDRQSSMGLQPLSADTVWVQKMWSRPGLLFPLALCSFPRGNACCHTPLCTCVQSRQATKQRSTASQVVGTFCSPWRGFPRQNKAI